MVELPESEYPLIIELAGMPRLGKTTFANSFIDLLKKTGYATVLSSYATHSSPIWDRWSFEFSAWTLLSFLKNYLEIKRTPAKFVVADRGLFDSTVWLKVKSDAGLVDPTTLDLFRSLAMAQTWIRSHILILAFVGNSDLIIRRHRQRRLFSGDSLVSTEKGLAKLSESITAEADIWNNAGINVQLFKGCDESIEESNARAMELVITSIENRLSSRATDESSRTHPFM